MEQVLKAIRQGEFKEPPPMSTKKKAFIFAPKIKLKEEDRKKNWYKVGKVIKRGHKVKLCNSSKLAAKRAYEYYNINKGSWIGPTARQLGKMNKEEFQEYLSQRKEVRDQVLLELWQDQDFEVEGPTSFGGGNMLRDEEDRANSGSHDDMFECDNRTEDQLITGSNDLIMRE